MTSSLSTHKVAALFVKPVRQAVTDQLSSAMVAKTDNILREAVTRFLGRDDWALVELKGRGSLNKLPSGVEVFCLDGVELVELYPITVEHEQKGAGHVMHATRQHRFLLPNAEITGG